MDRFGLTGLELPDLISHHQQIGLLVAFQDQNPRRPRRRHHHEHGHGQPMSFGLKSLKWQTHHALAEQQTVNRTQQLEWPLGPVCHPVFVDLYMLLLPVDHPRRLPGRLVCPLPVR